MKTCSKCQVSKPEGDFYSRSDSVDGLRGTCKPCLGIFKRAYYGSPEWKEYHRLYHREHKKEFSKYSKRHYRKYRATIRAKHKAYSAAHPEDNRRRAKAGQIRNGKRWNEQKRMRRKTDIHFRLRGSLSSRLTIAVRAKSGMKARKTMELLGCSIADFRIYIESKFEPGMSWDNYGRKGWHLDHIVPCAIFDLAKPGHQKVCFHFSNFQPMWASDNYRKRDKVLSDHQFKFL